MESLEEYGYTTGGWYGIIIHTQKASTQDVLESRRKTKPEGRSFVYTLLLE
jgi:hypothetical protein